MDVHRKVELLGKVTCLAGVVEVAMGQDDSFEVKAMLFTQVENTLHHMHAWVNHESAGAIGYHIGIGLVGPSCET